MKPHFDLEPILSAKTEWAFWPAFERAHLAVSAWPNGLLLLWTPTAPYLALYGNSAVTRELREMDGEFLTSSPIGPLRMGDIRRDVRRGDWVLSVRDTEGQWTLVHDQRQQRRTFQDPMLPSTELGLAALSMGGRS